MRRRYIISGIAGVLGTAFLCFVFRDVYFLGEAFEKASGKWHHGKPS